VDPRVSYLEVRYYKPELKSLGPVLIEVYRLAKIEPLELGAITPGDAVDRVYDILANVVERYRSSEFMVVEVRAYLKTGEIAAATLTRQPTRTMLMMFPRPVRLVRLGVKLRENGIRWYRVSEELYVYQGKLELPEDVELVVLDTEEGVRVVTRSEVADQLEELRLLKQQEARRRRRKRKK
jgi:hypothetical protein